MRGGLITIVAIVALLGIIGGLFIFQSGDPSRVPYFDDKNEEMNQSEVPDETPSQENRIGSLQIHEIEISGFAYKPSTLKINVGDTITWINKDFDRHTVTSDSGNELDSQLLSRNQEYSHTFLTAGTFDYHCTPHPYMKGMVVVE